jgi:hypothetical protein
LNYNKVIHLAPPKIYGEYIKEKIVCIRAHRERIFNVSIEKQNNKLIMHNYGQGGAGWTFLFGCVNESLRQFQNAINDRAQFKNKPIAVIGAGCYGLLTAIKLKRLGHQVQIIAQETDSISSHKAAGFFFPRPRKSSTNHERVIFHNLGIESHQEYLSIIQGSHPFINQGPKILPAYYGLDIDPGFAPYIEKKLISAPESVTIDFNNGKSYEMMAYQTLFINSSVIMQELERLIQEYGISIKKIAIEKFEDLEESIIYNCAGLGARTLTNDTRVIPVQGHLITLQNQEKENLQYMINVKIVQITPKGTPRDELIYFAPKEDGILGVTFIRGQDSLTANLHEFERLIKRCQNFFGMNISFEQ